MSRSDDIIETGLGRMEKYRLDHEPDDPRPQHPISKMFEGLEEVQKWVENGEYHAAARVRDLAMKAIRILESSPVFPAIAHNETELPQIVPCGPVGGPLFEAWLYEWEALEPGAGLPLPKPTKAKFRFGKPAGLAFWAFRRMAPVWMEAETGPLPTPHTWEDVTKRLPALGSGSAKDWRDAAMMLFEQLQPDFTAWLEWLPDYQATATGAAKRKATGKAVTTSLKWERTDKFSPDSSTAKSAVKEALLHGFRTVAANVEFDWILLHRLNGMHRRA